MPPGPPAAAIVIKRSTILIVDDILEIRYLLRILLANVRHCQIVGEAENGVRTLELVRELRPEIVVLDVDMPLMGGLEALAEIRQIAPQTRVIMYSSDPRAEERCVALGAAAYLAKGADPLLLVDTVRQVSLDLLQAT
jgi:DNA-binding NarL/FixJ family response regulator